MQKLTKFVLSIVLMATTSFIISGGSATAEAASKADPVPTNSICTGLEITAGVVTKAEAVTPRASGLEWRYKSENGVVYRRLYDTKKNCWVTNWEKM